MNCVRIFESFLIFSNSTLVLERIHNSSNSFNILSLVVVYAGHRVNMCVVAKCKYPKPKGKKSVCSKCRNKFTSKPVVKRHLGIKHGRNYKILTFLSHTLTCSTHPPSGFSLGIDCHHGRLLDESERLPSSLKVCHTHRRENSIGYEKLTRFPKRHGLHIL